MEGKNFPQKSQENNNEYTKEMVAHLREYTNSFTAYIAYSQISVKVLREKLKKYPLPTFERFHETSPFEKPTPEELKNPVFAQKIIQLNQLADEINKSDSITIKRYKEICEEVLEIAKYIN